MLFVMEYSSSSDVERWNDTPVYYPLQGLVVIIFFSQVKRHENGHVNRRENASASLTLRKKKQLLNGRWLLGGKKSECWGSYVLCCHIVKDSLKRKANSPICNQKNLFFLF